MEFPGFHLDTTSLYDYFSPSKSGISEVLVGIDGKANSETSTCFDLNRDSE